ncbi:MAG: nucleotidyltransferase domain-containing protein [Muribaculaceae bacterium]|nr:nucleotidyltransferase domain-containing protein [Muribaculaceae bacterium]
MNFNDLNFEKIKNYLASKPIEKVWLFGSYARGTQTLLLSLD